MVTRKTKQSLIATVTFAILPVLVITKSAATLFGGGPEIAQASYDRLPFIVNDEVDNVDLSLTDQQQEAFAHIALLKEQQFGQSPLHRATETVIGNDNTSPPPVLPSLQITIQMIMSSTAGNTALIDGKPYKVGDKLLKSPWIIRQIDGEARSVTLENPQTGQTEIVEVQAP